MKTITLLSYAPPYGNELYTPFYNGRTLDHMVTTTNDRLDAMLDRAKRNGFTHAKIIGYGVNDKVVVL